MFLGTPRYWWIAAALPLVGAFALLLTGGPIVVVVLLLLLAMVLFGMAPMRYGRERRRPSPPETTAAANDLPAKPRPAIHGRDASEV